MMTLLLVIPTLILAIITWKLYRWYPISRPLAIAIMLGIGYWYVLPGSVFIQDTAIQGSDSNLLQFYENTLHAILLIILSFALLMLLPAAARQHDVQWNHTIQCDLTRFSWRRFDALLFITIISAISLLVFRYEERGPAFALRLLVGLTSAREYMSFENTSGNIGQSMTALWEVLTTFSSIFLAATLTWLHRTVSMRFFMASLATLIVFASNGTRSVLLLLILAVLIAILSRPQYIDLSKRRFRITKLLRALFPSLLMICLIVLASKEMVARFENSPSQENNIIINSVASNNDMFRELLFSILNGKHYRSNGLLFLETPITFAMPSFLGFKKTIPPHLVDFNLDRAGINLVSGSGNVFPGLIADVYLCFGDAGPFVLAALSAVFFWVFWLVTVRRDRTGIGRGLFVTLLAYYVISFRNLQGSLGILVVASYVITILFTPSIFRRLFGLTSQPLLRDGFASLGSNR